MAATVTGLLFLFASAGCGEKGNAEKDAVPAEKVPVELASVLPRDLHLTLTCSGSLEGFEQATLYGKIPEVVTAIKVKEGQRVTKGQLLIELEKAGPHSNYLQSQAIYLNAEKNYQKLENLYQQKAVSEQARDQAKTNYEVALANFNGARDLVEIKSPIGGQVTEIDLVEGQQVPVGQVIAVVAKTAPLRLKFAVSYAEVKLLKPGQSVRVTSELQPGKWVSGSIAEVSGSADPVTRTFQVEALLANPEGLFKPGMFAQGEAAVGTLKGALAIPKEAVVLREGRPYVFAVNSDVAKLVAVETGAEAGGLVEIRSGLKAGDQVVTAGQSNLFDGLPVRRAETAE